MRLAELQNAAGQYVVMTHFSTPPSAAKSPNPFEIQRCFQVSEHSESLFCD